MQQQSPCAGSPTPCSRSPPPPAIPAWAPPCPGAPAGPPRGIPPFPCAGIRHLVMERNCVTSLKATVGLSTTSYGTWDMCEPSPWGQTHVTV